MDDSRMKRKTSDDREFSDYRGNRSGESQMSDNRKDNARDNIADIAGDRRGNQMKEEKAQLNHSSDPD